jgi:hypothetical protein
MTNIVEETKPVDSAEITGELDSVTPAGTAETINEPVIDTNTEGNTESRAMKAEAEAEKPLEKPAEQIVQPAHNVFSERERQFQADRDRAETQLKNLYKQILPYSEIDPVSGQFLGIKSQVQEAKQQVQPGSQLDELMDKALLSGDKGAMKEVMDIYKNEIIEAARTQGMIQVQNMTAIDKEMNNLKTEYPSLVLPDGNANYSDPLFLETAKILEKNPEFNNPMKVRIAVELAEARLLKRGLPSMTQQIKNDAQTKLKGISASASIVGTPIAKEEVFDGLTPDQVSALRKEKVDESEISRINKIWKQARKEGGLTL